MIGTTTGAIALSMLSATLALAAAPASAQAAAQAPAAPYPAMAPLAQYLIPDRDAEVALARTAAPPTISNDATVLVLTRAGYETAVRGGNGFVCLVERAWMSAFDDAGFWNPKNRSPICYNPPAARSVLAYDIARTKLVLAGRSRPQMLTALKAAVAARTLKPPESGAMSYMLSPRQYLNDAAGAWRPHLMFHVPPAQAGAWGANLAGSPVMVDADHTPGPEPETIFMVAVGKWSDGTPVAQAEAHGH
jgi:hypothetical protein